MSVVTDLQLMFATCGILFKKESTEGVSVNQITAIDYENESARSYAPQKTERFTGLLDKISRNPELFREV